MKHFLTSIAVACCIYVSAQSEAAQDGIQNQNNARSENPSVQAAWDVQFSYDITATTGSNGCAAICYLNNEFWISKWGSDTIIRYNAAGTFLNKFQVPGLSGVRSFTTDGTYIYASNNTNTIYRIDPVTASLSPPHTVSSQAFNLRWATYDSTLNLNAGGFWVGSFNTDLVSIDMSGNTLSSIPQATHGLSGMYGAAIDNNTAGGPYLWIFCQMAPSNTVIKAVSISTGQEVGSHDVMTDVGPLHSLANGLAGGIFVTRQYTNGIVTLMGVIQSSPNNIFFGYEIQYPFGPVTSNDLEVTATYPVDGNTMVPSTQTSPGSYAISYTNNSIATLDSFNIYFSVLDGVNSPLYAETLQVYNLLPGASNVSITQAYALGVNDTYTLKAYSQNSLLQVDSLNSNDSAYFTIVVNDSAFAHDSNMPDSALTAGVTTSEWGYLVSKYTMNAPDVIGGIWIRCTNPVVGDSASAVIFDTISGSPGNLIAQGPTIFLDSSNWQFLPFTVGVPLTYGEYAFGVYDPANSYLGLSVEQTPNYEIGSDYIYQPSIGWNSAGYNESWFIRPMLESAMLHVADDSGPSISVFPNPTSGMITVFVGNDAVKNIIIRDLNGKIVKTIQSAKQNIEIDLSDLAHGTYVLNITTEENNWSQTIIR